MTTNDQPSRRGTVALFAGVAASTVLAPPAAAAPSGGYRIAPSNLHFEITRRCRPVHLIPPRLVRHDTERPGGRATLARVRAGGTVRTGQRPVAPWASVVLDLREPAADGGAVQVRYDAGTAKASMEWVRSGSVRTVHSEQVRLTAPFTFAVVVTANAVSAFSSGGGHDTGIAYSWQPLVTDRGKLFDLMDLHRPAQLERLRFVFGGRGAVLGRARAGPSGQFGLRDVSLVRNAGGTPYLRDGLLHFTAASSGRCRLSPPGAHGRVADGSGAPGAHGAGRFPLLLVRGSPGRRSRRAVGAGRRTGRFIALACGGDLPTPGVTVRHGTGGEELLGGVHLIKAKQLELPFEEAAWDPALRLIDSRWHYAYANVTGFQPSLCFRPVLVAAAPDGDYDEDIRIRREDVAWPNNNEGFRFQRFGDRWYPLTSDAESRQCLVRDMAMRPHKSLDAPNPLGAPFPEVFPLPGANGRERWLAVTSDERSCEDGSSHPLPGYGVHGDVIVVRADHRQPETLRGQTCGTAVQPRGRVARPSSCAVRGSPVRRPCPGGIPAPGGVTALGVGRSAGGAVPVGPPVSRGLPP